MLGNVQGTTGIDCTTHKTDRPFVFKSTDSSSCQATNSVFPTELNSSSLLKKLISKWGRHRMKTGTDLMDSKFNKWKMPFTIVTTNNPSDGYAKKLAKTLIWRRGQFVRNKGR